MNKKTFLLTTMGSTLMTIVIFTLFGLSPSDNILEQQSDEQIGTIKIWPGNSSNIPSDWRICDGSPLFKADYARLYEKIGSFWDKDQGYNTDFFRVPDLRGVFLRGANGNERDDDFKEPENNERIRLYTGTNVPARAVGSFQADASKLSADLEAKVTVYLQGGGRGVEHGAGNNTRFSQGDFTGHAHRMADLPVSFNNNAPETRPTNAYVHFIIKVK